MPRDGPVEHVCSLANGTIYNRQCLRGTMLRGLLYDYGTES